MSLFPTSNITTSRLRIAGWFSILSTLLYIPIIFPIVGGNYFNVNEYDYYFIAATFLTALYVTFFFYIYNAFRDFLLTRNNNKRLSKLLIVMMWSGFGNSLNFVLFLIPPYEPFGSYELLFIPYVGFALQIVSVVATIIFGIKILKMDIDLYGLRKKLGLFAIVGGNATILILSPYGTVIGLAFSVILGMILLRAADESKILSLLKSKVDKSKNFI
jgi:hypothetical protein